MGSKPERQNQHIRRLMKKIDKFKKKGKSTAGLEKDLAYCTGDAQRPQFKTGALAGNVKFRN